ncbi:MAG TPA: hypothetical protein VFV10_12320 [Gammaproteobacteria bacterium]|nr:hypothetical protein [Gammaproteobacteria bacterium]
MHSASETKFFFEDFPGTITFEAGEPAPAFVADVADGRHRGVRVGR